MDHRWMRMLGALGLGLVMTPALVRGQAGDAPGPIDSLQDIQDTGRMFFKMADTNNDGLISQKEAVDAGNLLVGGFFFRADANGDGTLSREEAQQAREALFAQQPLLRFIAQRAQQPGQPQPGQPQPDQPAANNATQNPVSAIGNILDSNNDRQLQATEVRQAVQTAVQGLFATADTDRDGQMSPTEINAAVAGVARSVAQAVFQQADADNNGQLSQAEFDKAIIEPARIVFRILDANGDGQISREEGQSAERIIGSQLRALRVPEPPNSPRRLIESGRTPGQVAPVPAVNIPNQPQPGQPQPGQPLQPGQPQPPR